MNRRSFLTSAGAATAAMAVPTLLTTRKARGETSINTAPFYSAAALHCVAIKSYVYSSANPTDYANIAAATGQVRSVWAASNLDSLLRSSYNSVTEPMIAAAGSKVNTTEISNALKPYIPTMTPAQVGIAIDNFIRYVAYHYPGFITTTLGRVRSGGMLPYIDQSITAANQLAALIPPPRKVYTGGYPHPSPLGGAQPPHPFLPDGPNPAKCQYDSLALLAAGTALTVIAVMSGVGVIAIGVEGLLSWGGIATASWSIAHALACPL